MEGSTSTRKGWKCNHCELNVMGTNAARLLYHLSGGDVELRSPDHGHPGVAACHSVPWRRDDGRLSRCDCGKCGRVLHQGMVEGPADC